jgi:ATPase subunit of ABC transporter with duplicated ATPase domains
MSDEEMNTLLAEQAELQERIDAANGWELDRTVDIALDALRCPPAESPVTNLSGGERRRVALCRCCSRSPTCCCSTSRPTTWTPRASPGWRRRCATTPARC